MFVQPLAHLHPCILKNAEGPLGIANALLFSFLGVSRNPFLGVDENIVGDRKVSQGIYYIGPPPGLETLAIRVAVRQFTRYAKRQLRNNYCGSRISSHGILSYSFQFY